MHIFFFLCITIIFKTFVQINHHSLFLFFQVIENDIKRRCSLTRWLMKILYETRWSKKKFDGGTLLDENRPVRRRNRGIDLLVDYESSHVDNRRRPLSMSLIVSRSRARASFASLVTILQFFVLQFYRAIASISKNRLKTNRDSFIVFW